jgi:DNA-binding NarL/FixJ family response regulator
MPDTLSCSSDIPSGRRAERGSPFSTAVPTGAYDGAAGLWPYFLTGQETEPVRVLLIDDDECVRHVIAQELLSDPRIQLEGQAGSMRDGRRLLATHEFDVLMVDLRLGDGSGFELIGEARKHRSNGEIIVISALEDDAHVLHALGLGATGYLLKNAWLQSFAQAVLNVVNGGAAITPRLARRLLGRLNREGEESPQPVDAPVHSKPSLSPRECEILRLVAGGYVSGEIGAKLGIAQHTVNVHIKNIYRKLHVHSRAQAVSHATQVGLI